MTGGGSSRFNEGALSIGVPSSLIGEGVRDLGFDGLGVEVTGGPLDTSDTLFGRGSSVRESE